MNYHVWALCAVRELSVRFLALACCLLLFTPAVLAAQGQDGPSPEKNAQYRQLIDKALQEYALGHWPEARVFFSDAHALWPNARTLRGLGMTCYEERSYAEAVGYLEQAIESKTQPLTAKLASEAQDILAQATRFVASAFFEISPARARVTVDDQPIKTRPNGSVLLNPGEHALQVSSAGYDTERRTLHAEAGRELHVQMDLRSSEAPQPTASAPPSVVVTESAPSPAAQPETRPLRYTLAGQNAVAAGALSAVGLAGIATGWVFYALRDKLRVELWEFALTEELGFEQSRFGDFQMRGGLAMAATGVGALAMSLAQYFWLPDHEPVPAWAWAVSGVGGAAALGALGWAVFGKHCDVTDRLAFCRSTLSDPMFAPMLALQTLPFLTLPIMYAIRERVPVEGARLTLGTSEGAGLQLTIAGAF